MNMKRACNIFLTGHPGVGKTTIVKHILLSCSQQQDTASKAVTFEDGDIFQTKNGISISGFFTEERVGVDGKRNGFDLISFLDSTSEDTAASRVSVSRTSLSRAATKPQKPNVGKYQVEVDNIEHYAINSLKQVTKNLEKQTDSKMICILDEIGKMEMCCSSFIPAVNGVLDKVSQCSDKSLLIGTLPTPRYGHVIQAVENVRARDDDVLVLLVNKANRDELRKKLEQAVSKWASGGSSIVYFRKDFEEYIYHRPIGQGSITKPIQKSKSNKIDKSSSPSQSVQSCDPLIHEIVPAKFLLLGHTASPKPNDLALSYSERSMWNVLANIHSKPYKTIKDESKATEEQKTQYKDLRQAVLESGVCVWDVLANVHIKRGKQKASEDVLIPNEVSAFLKRHKSIKTIGFIGRKAQTEFKKQFPKEISFKMVVLPSSSNSNSRITLTEKAYQWKDAMKEA